MIQLHRLEGFYRVAIAHGYAAAARAFPYPITQPAVHQQVRKLEGELGTALFERVGRDRVELTAAGRHLYDFCAPFFEELPNVVRSVGSGSFGGTLRIDAAPLEIRHVLPRWIKRIRKRHPDIDVDLEEVQTPDPKRLMNCEADLLVDFFPAAPPGVQTRKLAEHHLFLVVPTEWLRGGRMPSLLQLGSRPFVGYHPRLFQYEMQLAGLRGAGVEPDKRVSASSTESILGFVSAGLGYSMLPWPGPRGPRIPGVTARRRREAGTVYPISVAWRKRKHDDPLVTSALACL